jgi:ADP-ribose pyrophosphatase YjhB (NUDIX family)
MAWIEDDKGSLLLVRQTVGQKLWTFPGGKVKRNESLERALKREVREETGLSVRGPIIFRCMIGLSAERSQFCSESWCKGRPPARIFLPTR